MESLAPSRGRLQAMSSTRSISTHGAAPSQKPLSGGGYCSPLSFWHCHRALAHYAREEDLGGSSRWCVFGTTLGPCNFRAFSENLFRLAFSRTGTGRGHPGPRPVPVPDLPGGGDAPPSPSPICPVWAGTLPRPSPRFPSGGPRPARVERRVAKWSMAWSPARASGLHRRPKDSHRPRAGLPSRLHQQVPLRPSYQPGKGGVPQCQWEKWRGTGRGAG